MLGFAHNHKNKENFNNVNTGNVALSGYCSLGYSQGSTIADSQTSSYRSDYKEKNMYSAGKNSRNGLREEAEKTLDAPGARDDFYLSILDWSKMGPLGIALEN